MVDVGWTPTWVRARRRPPPWPRHPGARGEGPGSGRWEQARVVSGTSDGTPEFRIAWCSPRWTRCLLVLVLTCPAQATAEDRNCNGLDSTVEGNCVDWSANRNSCATMS